MSNGRLLLSGEGPDVPVLRLTHVLSLAALLSNSASGSTLAKPSSSTLTGKLSTSLGAGQLPPACPQAGVIVPGSSLHGELEPLGVLDTMQQPAGSR